ncbi:glycosyltransferase family 2 protein [Paenibacillus sp. PL91]|uniref:glycosyltransferase family 2 protein n=1 Tax=Paenibacillus sp. PL91 TaxID=2729538 RepID=UPI00145E2A35|nr:glycosyltransferase family 2 protein [Paenibacillus sp. PL91]MBC9200421.1 glycosyltransferase family 2 protein [Paenibacillus sp. PL91]
MLTNSESAFRVSVIIPTLNAGSEFDELLERLQRQSVPPHEIIVIDSASEDGTQERARKAGVRLMNVERKDFDHGGTRNQAANQAQGNILLFMTQDALPYNENLIEALTRPLIEQETIVYSYARQLARPGANVLEQLARQYNYPAESQIKSYEDIEQLGIKTFFCSNVCSAIKRDTFEAMGRFQEPVIFNEDLFMAAKCILTGYKVAYSAEAVVYHSHDYSIKQQFKRYFDNGISMRCNAWITPYSAVGKAGSKLVKLQLQKLHQSRQWHHIPRLVAESAAKLIGYKLGMNFRRLPSFITRRLSMHRLILTHIENNRPGVTLKQ